MPSKTNGQDFEEEWSKIKNGELIIKWYYFPTATNLHVKIADIKAMKVSCQLRHYAKNWGADSWTWWSCDMKRNFRSKPDGFYNVWVDTGETFKKGFTVRDVRSFVLAIRKYSAPDLQIIFRD
ncbi:unnamed protein product [Caenorhabditis bovis]|uniref:Uncharacterized protein n=1 Tax=Caenorhabditis bovis TaxID=2654633 RepID=A0A8S1EGT3_9PELO|nr:unnamed protein product [Caenorhabditis bovis]